MAQTNQPTPKPNQEQTQPESSETVEKSLPEEDNEPMPNSRMRRNLEKQSKRTLVVTLAGIIALIALLILYGPTLIINFSLFIGSLTGKKDTIQQQISDEFIAPPILDPQFTATNSASIRITGQITNGEQIKLYVNDELVDTAKPKKDNTFTFDDVRLKEGENELKAIAVANSKSSAASNIVSVAYFKNPPQLTVDYPSDGASLSGSDNPVTIKGKTDPDVRVTVNDFVAITKSDGNFSYTLPLQNSENKIKVVATDRAGNKAEKEIKVTYSP